MLRRPGSSLSPKAAASPRSTTPRALGRPATTTSPAPAAGPRKATRRTGTSRVLQTWQTRPASRAGLPRAQDRHIAEHEQQLQREHGLDQRQAPKRRAVTWKANPRIMLAIPTSHIGRRASRKSRAAGRTRPSGCCSRRGAGTPRTWPCRSSRQWPAVSPCPSVLDVSAPSTSSSSCLTGSSSSCLTGNRVLETPAVFNRWSGTTDCRGRRPDRARILGILSGSCRTDRVIPLTVRHASRVAHAASLAHRDLWVPKAGATCADVL